VPFGGFLVIRLPARNGLKCVRAGLLLEQAGPAALMCQLLGLERGRGMEGGRGMERGRRERQELVCVRADWSGEGHRLWTILPLPQHCPLHHMHCPAPHALPLPHMHRPLHHMAHQKATCAAVTGKAAPPLCCPRSLHPHPKPKLRRNLLQDKPWLPLKVGTLVRIGYKAVPAERGQLS